MLFQRMCFKVHSYRSRKATGILFHRKTAEKKLTKDATKGLGLLGMIKNSKDILRMMK